MSLFGGHHTYETKALGIDFSGAQYGAPVPVVYGQNKVAGNCIWYGDFTATAHTTKQGKGGSAKNTSYTYSASFQMGLCEGVIGGVATIYDGSTTHTVASVAGVVQTGTAGQAPWSHLTGSAAIGYSQTAIFSVANLQLGSSASLPNYNYEVQGLCQFGGGIVDANPAAVLNDLCTDPTHGVGFASLGSLTQWSNYCVASGLFVSPVYDQQTTANSIISDLLKYTNADGYWSEGVLKVTPRSDTAATGNGVTYTPALTPIVALGVNDFIVAKGATPVLVTRKAPADSMNIVRVDFSDRSNTYHTSTVVASIDMDVNANGARADTSQTVDMCTTYTTAKLVSQNLLQQDFYVRNTYEFTLSWRYCYLEPTDIVTLTDANLGLNGFPVRITEVEEDEQGLLKITAEEFPAGIGHSAIYNTQGNTASGIDPMTDPGAVNAPMLFRGPGFLCSPGQPEIWCAVNGSGALWGGCDVYLSQDNVTYTYVGTQVNPARYGDLATALPVGSDPDTTHTPQVQLYAPGQLLGGTQADADNFVTLALVDGEIISYETASLVGDNLYQLSYIRRGAYGTAIAAHAVGAPFARLDDGIFRMPVDPSMIGKTVYLKFLSFNSLSRTPRTLASETAYTYVVGTSVELPDVPAAPSSFAATAVADGINLTWTNPVPAAVGATSIYYATSGSGPFTFLAQVGPTATSFHHSFKSNTTYYYQARSRGPLVSSGWSAYTAVVSTAGIYTSGIVVAGSGVQIGDERNLPPIAVTNLGSQVPTAITYSAAAGTPATATISVAAFTVTAGSVTVNYNAMSVGTTGTNNTTVTYYLYFDDPTYAGGTQTLVATTNGQAVYAANGRVFVGSCAVTYPSSGSGGGSGSGGSGWCVCDDMFVSDDMLAADVAEGVLLDCIDLPVRGVEKFQRRVLSVSRAIASCVRITTSEGASLDCSASTPFDMPAGGSCMASQMRGKQVITDHGIERVVSVESIGLAGVRRISVGGLSYAAGADPSHRIYSHNNLKP